MKKFLLKIWTAINSPLADIIGGYILLGGASMAIYVFCESTAPCVAAFICGFVTCIGCDCIFHGFERRRKSSGSPDDEVSV